MPTDTTKLPLGGPAWLRAIADEKEEMLHALGSIDAEAERQDHREIIGLRDAADRMAELEELVSSPDEREDAEMEQIRAEQRAEESECRRTDP